MISVILKLGLTEDEVDTLINLSCMVDETVEEYIRKEEKGELTKEDEERYIEFVDFQNLISLKIYPIIENQTIIDRELFLRNAPERVRVLPEALEEHLKIQNRQQENDRQRIAMAKEGLGISV